MRCCDCEFRVNCSEKENDLTSFELCNIRIEKLSKKELNEKLHNIKMIDYLKKHYRFYTIPNYTE